MKFLPDVYNKSVFDIDYKKLKEKGIKCLAFDLDNTLTTIEKKGFSDKALTLVNKLKKDFTIVIISNNPSKKRVSYYAEKLGVEYVYFAVKPFTFGLRKISKRFNVLPSEIAMIGDQFLTDVYSAHRFKAMAILVDQLDEKDEQITKINRLIERRIEKKFLKQGVFERGKYYDGK